MTDTLAIVGPTASGKSDLAMRLARSRSCDIVSVDSMQVYRGMDIGTAKPTAEDQDSVPHHMIDVADPSTDYTVAEFQRTGREALGNVSWRAVVVGGSGLHLRALIDPLEFPPSDPLIRAEVDALDDNDATAELLILDPAAGRHVDLMNPRRVQRALEIARLGGGTPTERANRPAARAVRAYEPLQPIRIVGVDPGDHLRRRAEARLEVMLGAGLLEEIRGLVGRLGRNAGQAVGYKELLPVVRGEATVADGLAAAITATVALARRQRTFFRRDPRIRWIEWSNDPDARYERAAALLGVTP